MEKIIELRKKIDKIDLEILNLLKNRFEVTNEVWEIKKQSNVPFLQKTRWEELLNEKIERAKSLWIDEDMVKTIWNAIHISSLKNQGK